MLSDVMHDVVIKLFANGFPALPITFKRELQNVEMKEGESAEFCCELSKSGAPVDWRRGRLILKTGDKYEMKQEGCITKLLIHNIEEGDAGKYTCKTKDSQSTAELTVKGKKKQTRDQRYGCSLHANVVTMKQR